MILISGIQLFFFFCLILECIWSLAVIIFDNSFYFSWLTKHNNNTKWEPSGLEPEMKEWKARKVLPVQARRKHQGGQTISSGIRR